MVAEAVYPLVNEAESRRNGYSVSQQSLFAAMQNARSRKCILLAFYHSHPTGAAVPSLFDVQNALPGLHQIIVVPRGSEPLIRCWRFGENSFEEVLLTICDRYPRQEV